MADRVHELKCWPHFFAAIKVGTKLFEIRRNDRGFSIGDVLRLHEFDPIDEVYTGRFIERRVTYVTGFEQRDGFVVIGLEPVADPVPGETHWL